MKADLHLHTTASDGRSSPQEIVGMAARLGLKVIAITDHDTVAGLAPALAAAKRYPDLRVIPGVEVSTDVPHGEVHVLGYFIDYLDDELASTLERLRNSRQVRAEKMVAKLALLGAPVDWERVREIAGGGSIGRPHVAQALVERGHISSSREAFVRYIGRNGPAYVERDKLTPEQVVELIVRARGLPVLAHPAEMEQLEEVMARLQKVGLAGIEAYYNGYPRKTVKYLASLASKYGLVASGGSDYHGVDNANETPIGKVAIPSECVEQLFALAAQRSRA